MQPNSRLNKHPYINQSMIEGGLFMKKFKKLLVVFGLLMALGVIIPAVQNNANADDGITTCSNWPAADTILIF